MLLLVVDNERGVSLILRRCQVLRTLTGLIKHAKLSDVYELTNNYNNLKLNIK